jgi:hypothetical protein
LGTDIDNDGMVIGQMTNDALLSLLVRL